MWCWKWDFSCLYTLVFQQMENATQVGIAIFSRSLGPDRDPKLKSKLYSYSVFKDKFTANKASRGHFLKRYKDFPDSLSPLVALLRMKCHVKRQAGMRWVKDWTPPKKVKKKWARCLSHLETVLRGQETPERANPTQFLKVKPRGPHKRSHFSFSHYYHIALN